MSETQGKYDVKFEGKLPPDEILSARTTLGLTRRGMARALGITVRAIQAYERGDYGPSMRTMRDVNKLLDEAKEQRMAKEIGIPFSKPFSLERDAPATRPISTVQPPLPIPAVPAKSSLERDAPATSVREPTPTEIINRIAKLERLILAWFSCDSKDYQASLTTSH